MKKNFEYKHIYGNFTNTEITITILSSIRAHLTWIHWGVQLSLGF